MKNTNLSPPLPNVSLGHLFKQVPEPLPGEPLAGPFQITSHLGIGVGLLVPAGHCVLVVTPTEQRVLGEGPQWLRLPPRRYQAYTISLKQDDLDLVNIKLPTADGWNISISVNLGWKTKIPEYVPDVENPKKILRTRCLAVVAEVVNGYKHDKLVGSPRHTANTFEKLNEELFVKLKRVHHDIGLMITRVSVQRLDGDKEVMQPRREAAVSQEQADAAVRAVETKGEADTKEAEYDFEVSKKQQQAQMVKDLGKQIYQERIQERQRRNDLIKSAMNNITQITSGLLNNNPQDAVVADFQAVPMIDGESLVKIVGSTLAELRSLALAHPPDIDFSDGEDIADSFMRILDDLSPDDNGSNGAKQPDLFRSNGRNSMRAKKKPNPFSRQDYQ